MPLFLFPLPAPPSHPPTAQLSLLHCTAARTSLSGAHTAGCALTSHHCCELQREQRPPRPLRSIWRSSHQHSSARSTPRAPAIQGSGASHSGTGGVQSRGSLHGTAGRCTPSPVCSHQHPDPTAALGCSTAGRGAVMGGCVCGGGVPGCHPSRPHLITTALHYYPA